MTMIYALGHISGAHFNPAVTLSFAITRHLPWPRAIGYWAAQLAGAIAAAVLLRELFGNTANLGATLPNGSDRQSLVLEGFLTFFLMFVIISVATDVRAVGQAAAIAIGGTVGLEAMFAGPISGASMNPARSLGPALVSGTWESQWIYVVGPLVGAVLGALCYQFIRGWNQRRQRSQSRSSHGERNVMTTRVAIFSDMHGNLAADASGARTRSTRPRRMRSTAWAISSGTGRFPMKPPS